MTADIESLVLEHLRHIRTRVDQIADDMMNYPNSKVPAMLVIHAQWDDEAKVWYATSDDVPGLCVEASTFDELVNVATELTPELLELNHVEISGPVSLHITAERTLMAKAA